jgi:hypothetical protein
MIWPFCSPEPDDTSVGRKGQGRVEAGEADVPADHLQIVTGRVPDAQAKINDHLVDVGSHSVHDSEWRCSEDASGIAAASRRLPSLKRKQSCFEA